MWNYTQERREYDKGDFDLIYFFMELIINNTSHIHTWTYNIVLDAMKEKVVGAIRTYHKESLSNLGRDS